MFHILIRQSPILTDQKKKIHTRTTLQYNVPPTKPDRRVFPYTPAHGRCIYTHGDKFLSRGIERPREKERRTHTRRYFKASRHSKQNRRRRNIPRKWASIYILPIHARGSSTECRRFSARCSRDFFSRRGGSGQLKIHVCADADLLLRWPTILPDGRYFSRIEWKKERGTCWLRGFEDSDVCDCGRGLM